MDHFESNDMVIHGIDVDPKLIERAKEKAKNRDNVSFECADIMEDDKSGLEKVLTKQGRDKFDFVFCFSVSMWIHLNHGDQGLVDFIEKLSQLAKFVVLEPQPWKCYQTAARRMRKLGKPEFQHMKDMKHTKEDLEPFILKTCKTSGLSVVEEFGKTDWKRRIILMKQSDT